MNTETATCTGTFSGVVIQHAEPRPVHPDAFNSNRHTLELHRDDDRLGGHYGQHYYVEFMGETRVKVEHIDTYDRDMAREIASATAKLYGARLVDRRPAPCLYGWSSD